MIKHTSIAYTCNTKWRRDELYSRTGFSVIDNIPSFSAMLFRSSISRNCISGMSTFFSLLIFHFGPSCKISIHSILFDVCIDFPVQIRYRGVKLSQYKSMYLKKYQLTPSVESQVNTAASYTTEQWLEVACSW